MDPVLLALIVCFSTVSREEAVPPDGVEYVAKTSVVPEMDLMDLSPILKEMEWDSDGRLVQFGTVPLVWEFNVLALSAAREELKIDDDQWLVLSVALKQWHEAKKRTYKKYRLSQEKLSKLSSTEARRLKVAHAATANYVVQSDGVKAIALALDSSQMRRLSEITLQWRIGLSGVKQILMDEVIRGRLGLSKEQYLTLWNTAPEGITLEDRKEDEMKRLCLQVLEESQREIFKQMIGEPFAFTSGNISTESSEKENRKYHDRP